MRNKVWKKINCFFKRIFRNKKNEFVLGDGSEKKHYKEINNDFATQISAKQQLKNKEEQNQMAHKLLNYELFSNELTDEEIDEMIEWFKTDIEVKDKELQKIKNNILNMKTQLEEIKNFNE